MSAPSVLCVDDQRAFAEALAIALRAEGASHVATALSVDEALAALRDHPADVVVMDVDLPDVDGIEGTRRVKRVHPGTRVVVLTALEGVAVEARAAGARADAFLGKDASVEQLVAAVFAPPSGPMRLDAGALQALRDHVAAGPVGDGTTHLTTREREVLALLAAGVDASAIARQLAIGPHTCRSYIKNLLTKLDARSQLEAVAVAERRGILVGG